MKPIQLLLTFLLVHSYQTYGQRQVHHQTLYWVRYQNQITITPSSYINAEVDNRRFINPDVQNQLILHLRYHYRMGRWDLGGGLTGSLAYATIARNGAVRDPAAELRPVIEGSHEAISGRMSIQNRIRLDHRFMEDDPERSLFSSSDYISRARHRLQWKYVIRLRPDGNPFLTGRVSNEFMVNFRKSAFDQNRVYASFDIWVARMLWIEAGYIWIYQQRLGQEGEFFSRNVLRFSLIQKI